LGNQNLEVGLESIRFEFDVDKVTTELAEMLCRCFLVWRLVALLLWIVAVQWSRSRQDALGGRSYFDIDRDNIYSK